jgi:hypothetical protein
VAAAGPAAWPAHSVLKFLLGSPDATGARLVLLRILNPTDELVAGKWSDVLPAVKGDLVTQQGLPQVSWEPVHNSAWDTCAHAQEVRLGYLSCWRGCEQEA